MYAVVKTIKSCIRYGDFTLHAGQKSDWICDLLSIRHHLSSYRHLLHPKHQTVGIELGGYLLSGLDHGLLRKGGAYYETTNRAPPRYIVSLMDDVCTTEDSFDLGAGVLAQHGIEVGEYLCVLDRRKPENKNLEIRSLVTAEDLGLIP